MNDFAQQVECLFLSRQNRAVLWLKADGGSLVVPMDISDWRKKIDELDRQLVDVISQRAQAAHEIGKLKRGAGMPIYEPERERAVFNNATKMNPGPLPDRDLLRIYERIMDVMRQIQREEIAPQSAEGGGSTELDSKVND